MLDEKALRRPTFQPGIPVVLADQQSWILPKPRVRFVPDDSDVGFRVYVLLDDDYAAKYAAYEAVTHQGRALVAEIASVELPLARHLLLANYDLSADQVAGLLQFSFSGEDDDPEGVRIRREVMEVATGNDPKPRVDGTA